MNIYSENLGLYRTLFLTETGRSILSFW